MKKFVKIAVIAFGVIFLLAVIGTSFSDEAVQNQLDDISVQVAEDAILQYNIALKNNNTQDAYLQATIIAQSYLSAKDEKNYKKWKDTENALAKKLGF
jgi:hypothetical protein